MFLLLVLLLAVRTAGGTNHVTDFPATTDRLYGLSRRRAEPREAPWSQAAIGRDAFTSGKEEGSGRVLGWALNGEDGYLPPGRTGWDYGRAGSRGQGLGFQGVEEEGEEEGEDEERFWSEAKEWSEDENWLGLLENSVTRLEDSLDTSTQRKGRGDSHEAEQEKEKENWLELTENSATRLDSLDISTPREGREDEDEKKDEARKEEDRRRQVLEDAVLNQNHKGRKPGQYGFVTADWGLKRMHLDYKNNLYKSMAHYRPLKQLQVRSLYFLDEHQEFVTFINQSITFVPAHSFRRNLDSLVMHLQFYLQILEIKPRMKPTLCEVFGEMEGAANPRLLLRLEGSSLFLQYSLKGVEEEAALGMSVVRRVWYHVRLVALQTRVTVTVTPSAGQRVTLTLPLPYHPVLAFAGMAVAVGGQDLSAYLMGLTMNNKLIDLKKVKGSHQPAPYSPFTFQAPVYFPNGSKYYAVDCTRPYRFWFIDKFEIDLPIARPDFGDAKSRLLLFGPTSEETGWALHAVPEAKGKLYLQFCLDWLNGKHCVRTTRLTLTNSGQYVLKLAWRAKALAFSVEVHDMQRGLYQRQAVRYGGTQPRCASRLFIGGVDAAWRDKFVAAKKPLFNFIGALTRVGINSFNVQLNAMAPESLGERNYASLLNRGHRAARVGTIPRSPIFLSVPVHGNDTHALSCWYDSMRSYRFFARAKFKAFWIDQEGRYIPEGNGSVHGKRTTLHVDRRRSDSLYACVVRLEGVMDLVPATFAVFRVHDPPPKAPARTLTAHPLGTAVCGRPGVEMCETYQSLEEEELIEIRDWKAFIKDTHRAARKHWLAPLYSGDYVVVKTLLWAYLLLSAVVVVLFVSLPCNTGPRAGAASLINRFLARCVFPRRLAWVQALLLMPERRRPFPYLPRRAAYHFAEREAYFSAFQKKMLYQCNLVEPPDPEEELIGFVMWSCLELGQLDARDAQDLMLYFNIMYQRTQPVALAGYTLWRDDWLEARYGRKVQLDDDELERRYADLRLRGSSLQAEDHPEIHVRDMYVYNMLKYCLNELEVVQRRTLGRRVTPRRRRLLRRRVRTVEWAVRVFVYHQRLPRYRARPTFLPVPFFTEQKFLEHRQVAWVLLRHTQEILVQLEEAYEERTRRGVQAVLQHLSSDLQELRVRRYKWFLKHELPSAEASQEGLDAD